MRILISALLIIITFQGEAQKKGERKLTIPVAKGDFWWNGVINHGEKMPIKNGYVARLSDNYNNQIQPLLLSNTGQVIWSEIPFQIKMLNDTLFIESEKQSLFISKCGNSLSDGFEYASANYFPSRKKMPDELLFSAPQYNTWIELMYNQNQEDILKYARQIIDNEFPPGVLMIDDNWQEDYGKWDFHPGRFTDPKAMVDSLHNMGFKVMLWICPFISADSDVFRSLRDEHVLLKDKLDMPAIAKWWNGYSGLLDLTTEDGRKWFLLQLENLKKKYKIDGFKFDAGDFEHYLDTYSNTIPANPQEQCIEYAKIGLNYPLNEYRAMWKMAGYPLVNRLCDKRHKWIDLQKLIPEILLQGIVGYNFTCPDMIGGGEYESFLGQVAIDQDLIVRSAQVHALMPMMQFSVAPWRILDSEHLNAVKQAVQIRMSFNSVIKKLAKESSITGKPIVRSMEFEFSNQGFAEIKDQFMLGDSILVAPIVEPNCKERHVILPKGEWVDWQGKTHKGGENIIFNVTLESLPLFFRK